LRYPGGATAVVGAAVDQNGRIGECSFHETDANELDINHQGRVARLELITAGRRTDVSSEEWTPGRPSLSHATKYMALRVCVCVA
jgi:hypothetical protein